MSLTTSNRIAVRSGNGVGKTVLAACAALWCLYSFGCAAEPAIVVTTAPTWHQVTEVLWRKLAAMHAAARYPLGGEMLKTRLNIADEWFAVGHSSDKPENMEGFHAPYLMYVVDEAKGVDRKIFEAVESAMTNAHGRTWLLMISTPPVHAPVGYFYDAFHKPRMLEKWTRFHIQQGDSPYVSEQWVKERAEEWGEGSALYQARVLGNFPEASDSVVIQRRWVENALKHILPAEGAVTLGVDVARGGENETVIAVQKGNRIVALYCGRGWDTMETVGRIRMAATEHDAEMICIDDVGVGGGVYDRLAELKENGRFDVPVEGINNGATCSAEAKDKGIIGLGTETWFALRERFERQDYGIPNDDVLIAQLVTREFKPMSSGIRLKSKVDMAKESLPSPDRADAVVLANWAQRLLTGQSAMGVWFV